MTRRALVIERPGTIELLDRPGLEPASDEIVVRPVFCGVCGTDLELLRGEVDAAFARYPLTLGHEWSGIVEAVGTDVEHVAPGDACVGEGIVPCGRCTSCLAGATNTCETFDELGFTREGGASDQLLLPARLAHRLDDGVSLVDAALVEPSAVVLRALEKAGPRADARVAVIGDGTIALLAVSLIALWSPAEVIVVGRRPEQAELTRTLGASVFTLNAEDAAGSDLVVEAAGTIEAIQTAVRLARRGGTVSLLGLPPAGRMVELPGDLLVNNDLTLSASFSYTSAAWARVVDLLNKGRIAPGRLVTHRFPLEDYAAAFAELATPTGTRGKILLEVSPRL